MNTSSLLPIVSALMTLPSFGVISFNGSYSENFDGLPTSNTTLTGTNVVGNQVSLPGAPSWEVARLGGSATTNSAINSTYATAGRFYSLANTTDSADRALVALGSGGFWGAFGVALTNNTGDVVNEIRVTYAFEIWGVQGTTTQNETEDRLTFAYGLSGGSITAADYLSSPDMNLFDSLDSVSPTTNMVTGVSGAGDPDRSRDGNAAEWRAIKSSVINGLNWQPDQTLFIRFADSDSPGFDAAMGVDDFSVVAIPEPSTMMIFTLALASLLGRRRK